MQPTFVRRTMTTAIYHFILLQNFPCILHTEFNFMRLSLSVISTGIKPLLSLNVSVHTGFELKLSKCYFKCFLYVLKIPKGKLVEACILFFLCGSYTFSIRLVQPAVAWSRKSHNSKYWCHSHTVRSDDIRTYSAVRIYMTPVRKMKQFDLRCFSCLFGGRLVTRFWPFCNKVVCCWLGRKRLEMYL